MREDSGLSLLTPVIIAGQQQHYFDSRLTYHASRSAMGVGMGAAGYPLTNSWGYQTSYPASAYLGYNSAGMAGAAAYTSSLSGYTSSVIDPLLTTSGTAGTGTISSDTTASPASGETSETTQISSLSAPASRVIHCYYHGSPAGHSQSASPQLY